MRIRIRLPHLEAAAVFGFIVTVGGQQARNAGAALVAIIVTKSLCTGSVVAGTTGTLGVTLLDSSSHQPLRGAQVNEPLTAEAIGAIGGPAYYHTLAFETGGATADRNFSYYLGLGGCDQEEPHGRTSARPARPRISIRSMYT